MLDCNYGENEVIRAIRVLMVIMVIMLIRVIRVASVKSSIGILTHQGHISKVNANAHSLSNSVSDSHHF